MTFDMFTGTLNLI